MEHTERTERTDLTHEEAMQILLNLHDWVLNSPGPYNDRSVEIKQAYQRYTDRDGNDRSSVRTTIWIYTSEIYAGKHVTLEELKNNAPEGDYTAYLQIQNQKQAKRALIENASTLRAAGIDPYTVLRSKEEEATQDE